MLWIPFLVKLGIFAGLILTLRLLSLEKPIGEEGNWLMEEQGEREDVTSNTTIEFFSDTTDELGRPLPSSSSSHSEEGRKLELVINNETFFFQYFPATTTVGDLAADFCRTHGVAIGVSGPGSSFKDCVIPLERRLRKIVEETTSKEEDDERESRSPIPPVKESTAPSTGESNRSQEEPLTVMASMEQRKDIKVLHSHASLPSPSCCLSHSFIKPLRF